MRRLWELRYPSTDHSKSKINSAISEVEAGALAKLATGRRVLDIGSAFGYSTVSMGLTACRVTTLDRHDGFPGTLEALRSHVREYGLDGRIEILVGDSTVLLPQLISEGRQYDLVFVDGNHTAPFVRSDCEAALRLCVSGGYIAVHDYGEDELPDVKQVVDEMFAGQPFELTETLYVVAKDSQ